MHLKEEVDPFWINESISGVYVALLFKVLLMKVTLRLYGGVSFIGVTCRPFVSPHIDQASYFLGLALGMLVTGEIILQAVSSPSVSAQNICSRA